MAAHDLTEQNRALVTAAFEAWRDGRAAITDLFSPAMTWRIEGRNAAARQYATTSEFVDEVLAPFAARFPTDAPFRPTTIRRVIADGGVVTVIWDGHGVANDGKAYDNSYAWILQLEDGLVVDGTAFFDSIAFDDLWQRVPPRDSQPA